MIYRRPPSSPPLEVREAQSLDLYRASGRLARKPPVDERLAPPETRVEYMGGAELFAAPADMGHATQHCDLTYVLRAHTANGYKSAVDMLTRTDDASDFAPDASIFPVGPNKKTQGRKLEELAFEVTDKQTLSVPTKKARELVARGVRRVFCILVKRRRVLEWSRATDGWEPLIQDAILEDRCLVRPLPIEALLDAAEADDAVAHALLDKRVPALERALAAREAIGSALGEARGEARGAIGAKRAAVITVLGGRGLALSPEVAARIAGCNDVKKLDRWLERALTAKSAEAVVERKARNLR